MPSLEQYRFEAALVRPACSHRERGPASRPIRSIESLSLRKKATMASGWLFTFASVIIFPAASTTQRLESSKETSIPA